MELREALETAFNEAEKAEKPEQVEQVERVTEAAIPAPEETQAEADARARDEKGRFAPKAEKAEPAPVEAVAQPAAEVKPVVERRAPTTWRKEAAARWADIPDDIKDEILKRENDARTGIQGYKADAEMARSFKEASKPFERTFQELGVSPVQAYQYLLNADAKLRYSPPQEKARYFAELAREYGIDLQQVTPLPPIPPEFQQMQQELNKLRQRQALWEEQQAKTLTSEIESFAQTHEHLEAVRGRMAILLQNGDASDLQDAYDKAIWADPEIRAQLLQQQVSTAAKKAEEQSLATRQRAAAVSVRGSSPASGSGKSQPESVRAALEAAWADHT